MARVLITGSSQGLGLLAGQQLVEQGHTVVLHARNADSAQKTKAKLPQCEDVVVGDVSSITAIHSVADQANALGRFDAVIHNVGLGLEQNAQLTKDGFTELFAVNVVAPYILTALMTRPDRLVYMSSGMHLSGEANFDDIQWQKRPWDGNQAYSDTKLFDLTLAVALAQRWPNIYINGVDPGWVPTRMGGAQAPDNLQMGAETQAWLAVSNDAAAKTSGQYFHHKKSKAMNPLAQDATVQKQLLDYLQRTTDIPLPV